MADSDDDHQLKEERLRFFVRLTERCVDVMSELDNKDLRSLYARSRDHGGVLDSYVFTYLSDRTLFLEVTAKFEQSEVENVGSYRFSSHPTFEKLLVKYTRTPKKPNPVLEKSRPWDVAVNLVMKVEALEPKFCNAYRRLLKREHAILDHLWQCYLADSMDFDDMTGIPMLFDYKEVTTSEVYVMPPGELIEEIDLYGRLSQKKLNYSVPTLSYMTIEKLGPNLSYIVDLMGVAKRQPVGLNISTAFKMFDQLVCRLLQIHRFGVVHNGVCPQNIYFGRSICYNVVYLNNFRAATLASSQPGVKPSINMRVAKDARFAALNAMKSADMHPVDDIESAFYTLLACIGPSLPWDSLFHGGGGQSQQQQQQLPGNSEASTEESSAQSPSASVPNSRQLNASVRAAKSAFWESNIHLERYIADLMHRLTDRELELFQLVAGILLDLYAKVKRLLSVYSSNKNSAEFCTQLCCGGSVAQLYTDLRKSVLMYFKFEQVPSFLNNLTFQQRQQSLSSSVAKPLIAWNLSEWCFNSVEVRPPLPFSRPLSEQVSRFA